jgi:xylan 1,4-beta-xylosidase
VLVWNYHDDDVAVADAAVTLAVKGLKAKSVRVREFRMDAEHSNAYAVWLKMGSPQKPTAAQYAALEKTGKLAELGPESTVAVKGGSAGVRMDLPRQGVELVRLSW